jgi:type IV pilus assembly protein PilW
MGIPLQSYEISSPVPTPTLSVCATRVVNPLASTDVLFVRHLDTEDCVAGAAGCPASPGELYFQRNRCLDSSSPGYSTTTYVFGTDTTAFNLHQRDCTSIPAPGTVGTLAPIRKYVSNLYYVRNYSDTVGDGIPTLVRSQFGLVGGAPQYQPEQAFIPGIQGFRVELGVDNVSATGAALTTASFQSLINFPNTPLLNSPSNRGDGYPDGAYVHCTTVAPCTAFQFMNTVAVKLYVLVRSENQTPGYQDTKTYQLGSTLGPFNDAYKRHLFTKTIRLTNVSGRRETPPS